MKKRNFTIKKPFDEIDTPAERNHPEEVTETPQADDDMGSQASRLHVKTNSERKIALKRHEGTVLALQGTDGLTDSHVLQTFTGIAGVGKKKSHYQKAL